MSRSKIPKQKRYNIYERDEYKCFYCSLQMTSGDERLSLEHKVPLAFGGKNTYSNLTTCCISCNRRRAKDTSNKMYAYIMSKRKQKKVQDESTLFILFVSLSFLLASYFIFFHNNL